MRPDALFAPEDLLYERGVLSFPPAMPRQKRPIVLIGAGSIVRDAHLPAYAKAGFEVAGIFDLDGKKARELATEFGIDTVFDSLEAATQFSAESVVFDLAVPASETRRVLEKLPEGAAVLTQKPLGENLAGARDIVALCEAKNLVAATNFQLRFMPHVVAARTLIERGVIGELCNFEVRVTVDTPWHLWRFLEARERVEIQYHTVHYLDLARSFLGEPHGVWAQTVCHPRSAKLDSTRTAAILDYGPQTRALISVNHDHRFGLDAQESYILWEGTRGAVKVTLGLLLDYPKGQPDEFALCLLDENDAPTGWKTVAIEGSWFPDAFIGTMASLQRCAAGETDVLPTRVSDSLETMRLVEAAYASSRSGATPL